MASTRTTITLDDSLAERARSLGINISAAARDGVAAAVHDALIARYRDAYRRHGERVDEFWSDV